MSLTLIMRVIHDIIGMGLGVAVGMLAMLLLVVGLVGGCRLFLLLKSKFCELQTQVSLSRSMTVHKQITEESSG